MLALSTPTLAGTAPVLQKAQVPSRDPLHHHRLPELLKCPEPPQAGAPGRGRLRAARHSLQSYFQRC